LVDAGSPADGVGKDEVGGTGVTQIEVERAQEAEGVNPCGGIAVLFNKPN
jgi:hypothetical protein